MGKKVAHSHEVPELKSFKPWKSGMKAKRRVLVRNKETGTAVQDENGDPMYEMEYQPISAGGRMHARNRDSWRDAKSSFLEWCRGKRRAKPSLPFADAARRVRVRLD